MFDEPRGRRKPPRHLADLAPEERKALAVELGLPGFRAKQLATHYFARLADDPAEMTDLPAGAARRSWSPSCCPTLMTPLRTLEADRGTTRKTLWKLFDGALVESVLMRYPGRVTMCVSSQAGCGMACPFCATGQGGLQRNMSTAEIVEQVVAGARVAGPRRGAGRAGPGLQRRLHGHGRADGQLQGRDRRRPPAHRPRARRARHVRARHHRLHGRAGAADPAARRRGHPGHPRAQPARARRRAAQRAGADQHPVLGRRDRRGRLGLRAHDQAAGVDRVRHDARHQRPGLARRPARRRAARRTATGAGCTST